jgi:hypothetical protein
MENCARADTHYRCTACDVSDWLRGSREVWFVGWTAVPENQDFLTIEVIEGGAFLPLACMA